MGVEGARGDGAVGGVEGERRLPRARRPLGGVDAGEERGRRRRREVRILAERVGEAAGDVRGGEAHLGAARHRRPLVVDPKLDQRGAVAGGGADDEVAVGERDADAAVAVAALELPAAQRAQRDRIDRDELGRLAALDDVQPRRRRRRRRRGARARSHHGERDRRLEVGLTERLHAGERAVGLDPELDEQPGRRAAGGGDEEARRRQHEERAHLPLHRQNPLKPRAERRRAAARDRAHVARVDRTELRRAALAVAKGRRERHARRGVDGERRQPPRRRRQGERRRLRRGGHVGVGARARAGGARRRRRRRLHQHRLIEAEGLPRGRRAGAAAGADASARRAVGLERHRGDGGGPGVRADEEAVAEVAHRAADALPRQLERTHVGEGAGAAARGRQRGVDEGDAAGGGGEGDGGGAEQRLDGIRVVVARAERHDRAAHVDDGVLGDGVAHQRDEQQLRRAAPRREQRGRRAAVRLGGDDGAGAQVAQLRQVERARAAERRQVDAHELRLRRREGAKVAGTAVAEGGIQLALALLLLRFRAEHEPTLEPRLAAGDGQPHLEDHAGVRVGPEVAILARVVEEARHDPDVVRDHHRRLAADLAAAHLELDDARRPAEAARIQVPLRSVQQQHTHALLARHQLERRHLFIVGEAKRDDLRRRRPRRHVRVAARRVDRDARHVGGAAQPHPAVGGEARAAVALGAVGAAPAAAALAEPGLRARAVARALIGAERRVARRAAPAVEALAAQAVVALAVHALAAVAVVARRAAPPRGALALAGGDAAAARRRARLRALRLLEALAAPPLVARAHRDAGAARQAGAVARAPHWALRRVARRAAPPREALALAGVGAVAAPLGDAAVGGAHRHRAAVALPALEALAHRVGVAGAGVGLAPSSSRAGAAASAAAHAGEGASSASAGAGAAAGGGRTQLPWTQPPSAQRGSEQSAPAQLGSHAHCPGASHLPRPIALVRARGLGVVAAAPAVEARAARAPSQVPWPWQRGRTSRRRTAVPCRRRGRAP